MEDREIKALASINDTLKALDEGERYRVIQWLAGKYVQGMHSQVSGYKPTVGVIEADSAIKVNTDGMAPDFATFAELLDASGAATDAERLLAAAYWLQVIEGKPSWKSFEVNKLLKDTGRSIKTSNALRDASKRTSASPAKVVQVSKSASTSGNGSKVLKLTSEGIKKVKAMLKVE